MLNDDCLGTIIMYCKRTTVFNLVALSRRCKKVMLSMYNIHYVLTKLTSRFMTSKEVKYYDRIVSANNKLWLYCINGYTNYDHLTHLSIDYYDNKYDLPKNLIYLRFLDNFDTKVMNYPKEIICLYFGKKYNQSVDNLPNKLKYLYFGEKFNQPVDNLPNGLLCLCFGHKKMCYVKDCFNQSINNLPKSLMTLTLGNAFNQPIDKLPTNLKFLSFGDGFDNFINMLPSNLIHVRLGKNFDGEQMHKLPMSVIRLDIMYTHIEHLLKLIIPDNLKEIRVISDTAIEDLSDLNEMLPVLRSEFMGVIKVILTSQSSYFYRETILKY